MPWRPLPRIAFAVATYPFSAISPADLPLEIGDELYIIEQGGGEGSWFRGYLVAPPSLLAGLTSVEGQTLEARVFSGIFPKCCVEVREVLGDAGIDGQAHGFQANGDGSRLDQSNGGSLRRISSIAHKRSLRRPTSNGSISTNVMVMNGETKVNGNTTRLARKKSQRTSNHVGGHGLARQLSHRSFTGSQSRSSPTPHTPNSDNPRDPHRKRPQAPVPMLKIGDETPTSSAEPLVDEIASCLREWHSKNLHELLLARRYKVLEKVSDLVNRLDVARRQLLHGVLTSQELCTLREEIVWNLVDGNKLLSNEVIVRCPEEHGRLLTGDDSAIQMSKLQSTMSLLDRPPTFQHDPIHHYHLLADVKAFVNIGMISPTLTMYLACRSPGGPPKVLSESLVVDLPHTEDFEKLSSDNSYRTLFTDLTSTDIGDGPRPGLSLCLIFKIQASQVVHGTTSSVHQKTNRDDENMSPGRPIKSSPMSSTSSVKGGRQSLMWAQKRFGSVRNGPQHDTRSIKIPPSTADSSSSTYSESRPTIVEARPTTQQGTPFVKRNVGVGVVNIEDLFGNKTIANHQVSIWAPAPTNDHNKNSMNDWDELVRDLLPSRSGYFAKAKGFDTICLSLQSFAAPDANDLIIKTPTLLQDIVRTPKTSFPGALTRSRSDVYVKLCEAFLPHQALLSHPERGTVQISPSLELKSVQLTLEVRKASGERIERCIFPGSNSTGQTAWRTSAVERGEAWNEMIKLDIPSEDIPGSHLIMSVADAPGFPFALAWMPLWNDDAFVTDGAHAPLLYSYDKQTSSSDKGRGAYLAFPWNSKGRYGDTKDETLTGPIATLKLETNLCSTQLSQDTTLLGILRWREQPRGEVLDLLRRFAFVPEIEIVKLVGDVFDALFSIMVEHAGKEDYEDSVFNAIVAVLGIVHDRRFDLGPFVAAYAEMKFDHPFATPCLIRSYLRLLANPSDPSSSRRVRATIKVGQQMLRFIVCARKRQEAKEADIGANTQSTFQSDVKGIFYAFEGLMKHTSPALVGSKTLVVQFMHTWVPELTSILSEDEILEIAVGFLNSCAEVQGKLILYKLVLILNLTNMTIFTQPRVRQKLSSCTTAWIEPYWGIKNGSTQWREQVRLCCSIVSRRANEPHGDKLALFAKAIQSYHSLSVSDQQGKDQLSLLFPTSYPFPSKQLSNPIIFDEALTELAALLATLASTRLPKEHTGSDIERTSMLFDCLDFILSLLSGSAFPKSWLSLYVFHHRSSLQILEALFDIMTTDFVPPPEDADDFNTELWSKYLVTLLTLVRSDTLALETFPEQKRRAVWKIAGDVREQGAILLKRSWEALGWESSIEEQKRYGLSRLGGFQVQYVPGLVAPIVELCLSVHEGLRNIAVKILQAMIISEWTLNEDLSVIQAEMIECFEILFQSKNIGESLVQKMFVNELLDLFGFLAAMPLDPMWRAIKDMIATTDELLELLAAVHSPDVTEMLRIMNTLQLMNFLKDMQKEDIFIRYVHHLAQVQAKLNNKTEAGLALRLHADLYTWGSTNVRPLADPDYPEQPSFDRKERLYFEMIQYYEEGEAWASALETYQELADQYQNSQFDFAKLARTQRSMATIYEAIAKGEWQLPRYFRVAYHGMGFSSSLRGKQFIFEGEPGERQSAFTDRMRLLHPSAQMVTKGDLEELEGQYLQISPVSPYRNLELPIYQQPKVAPSIREFVTSAKPHTFAVTSKRHSPSSGVQNQWIEKTLFSTNESFPTILRRSEVIAVDVLQLSPLQTAIERTTRKTSELAALEKKTHDTDEPAIRSLTDAILSSVDPSSVGSVAQYRQLLPAAPSQSDDDGEEAAPSPLEAALQIALLDHVSMLKHCLSHYMRHDPSDERASLVDGLKATFAPELAVLAPAPAPDTPEVLVSPTTRSFAGASSPTTPALTLTNGDTPGSPTEPIGRLRPLSRISLGFPKSSIPSGPRTNGSASELSAQSDGGSSVGNSSPAVHAPSQTKSLSPDVSHINGAEATGERPATASSGKSGFRLKKRLSSLGIGRMASKSDKSKGSDTMGGLAEE